MDLTGNLISCEEKKIHSADLGGVAIEKDSAKRITGHLGFIR